MPQFKSDPSGESVALAGRPSVHRARQSGPYDAVWRMNAANAVGLCAAGVSLALLPRLAPSLFTRVGMDGCSTRTLWAEVMAGVNCAFGGAYLIPRLCVAARQAGVVCRVAATAILQRRSRAAVARSAGLSIGGAAAVGCRVAAEL
jgi:hypothetical protein